VVNIIVGHPSSSSLNVRHRALVTAIDGQRQSVTVIDHLR
jgi:hypothetical protein